MKIQPDEEVERKRHILLYKSYLISLLILFFSILIVIHLFSVQNNAPDQYEKKIIKKRKRKSPYTRGNIYASDHSILAMSIKKYHVYVNFSLISQKIFKKNINFLCDSLELLFNKPKKFFYKKLRNENQKRNSSFLLAKNLDYSCIKKLRKCTIFEKGGLIIEEKIYRIYSLKGKDKDFLFKNGEKDEKKILFPLNLSHHKKKNMNMGYYYYKNPNPFHQEGLEKLFNPFITGEDGFTLEEKIGKNLWKIKEKIESKNGKNIHSTIHILLHNSIHNVFLKKMLLNPNQNCCECMILMDVNSGEICSIIGLEKKEGIISDNFNNLFIQYYPLKIIYKLIFLLSFLENYDENNGVEKYMMKNEKLKDMEDFFLHHSSGMEKIVYDYYQYNPKKTIQNLERWNQKLERVMPLGIEKKLIPNNEIPSWNWNDNSLFKKICYKIIKFSPFQILTFYNYLHQGRISLPYLIYGHHNNMTKKNHQKKMINKKKIENKKPYLIYIHNLLEKIGINNIFSSYHSSKKYDCSCIIEEIENDKIKSFQKSIFLLGYFPKKNPKYSCFLLISNPIKKEEIISIFNMIVKFYFSYEYKKEKSNQENRKNEKNVKRNFEKYKNIKNNRKF